MKRVLVYSLLLTVLLLWCVSCQSQETPAPKLRVVQDGYPDFDIMVNTLSELENFADLIVIGRFKDDSESVFNSVEKRYGQAVTSFRISKVYKGDVTKGSAISISEPYVIKVDEDGEAYVATSNYYAPSELKHDYLMFVQLDDRPNSPWFGTYTVILGKIGRHNADGAPPTIDAEGYAPTVLDREVYEAYFGPNATR